MGLFLSNCLVVFVHCPELADVSCRIIRNRGWITSGLPAGLFADRFFAFEIKFNYVIHIVMHHCATGQYTTALQLCGIDIVELKLNVILCSWQSELASLCLRGRAASVGVDRPHHPTMWRIHLMQNSCLLFFFFHLFSFSIVSYNIFTRSYSLIWTQVEMGFCYEPFISGAVGASSQTAGRTQMARSAGSGPLPGCKQGYIAMPCPILTQELSVGLTMCSFSHSWSHCVAIHMVLYQFKAKRRYLHLLSFEIST